MRIFPSVFLAMAVTLSPASAQNVTTACRLYGPSYQLASDTVEWSMTIGSGQTCIRGLRSAFATLDNVKLVVPPKIGQIKLQGPGFIYHVDPGVRGQDSFEILVTGKLNKIKGNSVIHVNVSVR